MCTDGVLTLEARSLSNLCIHRQYVFHLRVEREGSDAAYKRRHETSLRKMLHVKYKITYQVVLYRGVFTYHTFHGERPAKANKTADTVLLNRQDAFSFDFQK